MASTLNKAAKFWDKVAERYSKKPVANEEIYEKKLEVTRSYLRSDMEMLEFGCGTGSTAIAHSPHVKRILATDLSSKMIEIAIEKARQQNISNVIFEQASIEDISSIGRSFDAVLGLNVVHLVDDMEAAIAKVHGLLRPGGVFVSSTACIKNMMPLFRLIAPIGTFLGLFPPVLVFSIEELKQALTDAGFELEHEWLPGKNQALFLVARKPDH